MGRAKNTHIRKRRLTSPDGYEKEQDELLRTHWVFVVLEAAAEVVKKAETAAALEALVSIHALVRD